MDIKVRLSELPEGSCFTGGRGKGIRKKTEDGKVVTVRPGGRIRSRSHKGDPEVNPIPCPLQYIGIGQRMHPDQVVEIGDGRPRKKKS